jgi:hypothetical protein
MLKDAAALTEYDFETDKVSSVNSVIGDEREVTGVKSGSSNGIQYKEYTYKTESTGDDLLAYANHLLEAGWIPLDNFNVTDSDGTGRLAIQSADEGKILIMTLTFQEGEYTIRTEKSEGALTPK